VIYLDNAATSWPKPDCVYQAMENCMRYAGANPGRGGHRMALDAGRILYDCRDALAELFHIEDPNQIAFMLNATDAINTALFGFLEPGDHVVTTGMEHNAIARPLRCLERMGVGLSIIPVNSHGEVNIQDIKAACSPATKLIALGHASNVTGTIVPIEEIGKIAREKGARFLVDAAQTAGVEDIDVDAMDIDFLAFTGHKSLMGPQGTGGLWVREEINLKPMRWGGTGSNSESDLMPDLMPDKLESGTPNTVGIAGLGAGVRFILEKGLGKIRQHERELTRQLVEGLAETSSVIVYGPNDLNKQAAVVSFTIAEMDTGQVGYLLDRQYDIATRTGLHCAPWAHASIGTLRTGTVRASFGYFNTGEDVENILAAVRRIVGK
jgi:cysteine desulfurase / selenocysteine lyase